MAVGSLWITLILFGGNLLRLHRDFECVFGVLGRAIISISEQLRIWYRFAMWFPEPKSVLSGIIARHCSLECKSLQFHVQVWQLWSRQATKPMECYMCVIMTSLATARGCGRPK